MHVVIIAAIIVALAGSETASRDAAEGWLIAAAVAVYLGVAAALSRCGVSVVLKAMRRRGGPVSGASFHHAAISVACRAWLVAGLWFLISLGYGRWVTDTLGLSRVPLAAEAVLLAPFIAAVLLNWTIEYPLHRVARLRLIGPETSRGASPPAVWTRRQHLANNIRHQLLFVIVPVGLIILLEDALVLYVAPHLPEAMRNDVIQLGTLASAAVVFAAAPMMIVRIWRTERLADGPLRTELSQLCSRFNLKYRDILIWRSEGVIANAGVIGFVPATRYILLSDSLIDNLSPLQVRAIFAHEAAHIMHRHIPYFVLFFVGAWAMCVWLWSVLGETFLGGPYQAAAAAGTTVAALAGAFGWVSRRFERQSDVTAAWLCDDEPADEGRISPEGSALFAHSLERVAQLNGIPPRQRNWRHGSIASRVAYILWLGGTGGRMSEIGGVVRRIKLALWILAVGAVVVHAWPVARGLFSGG